MPANIRTRTRKTTPIGAVNQQPTNPNFLVTHRFRVVFHRAPNINYFCQEANLPGISMGSEIQSTPLINIPIPGDHITFDDLSLTFPVDEDMGNYKEIATWMIGLGFPQQNSQYQALQESTDGLESDISLIILDADLNPAHTVFFRDAFPTALSGINFDTKVGDVIIPVASAVFKYLFYEFDEVNKT